MECVKFGAGKKTRFLKCRNPHTGEVEDANITFDQRLRNV